MYEKLGFTLLEIRCRLPIDHFPGQQQSLSPLRKLSYREIVSERETDGEFDHSFADAASLYVTNRDHCRPNKHLAFYIKLRVLVRH